MNAITLHRHALTLLPLLLVSILTQASGEGTIERPFRAGERLRYELKWRGMNAGQLILEVQQTEEGDLGLVFVAIAKPSFVGRRLYRGPDQVMSTVDGAVSQTLMYVKTKDERELFRTAFDEDALTARCQRPGQDEASFTISRDTLDPLSLLYAFRRQGMALGGQNVMVSDGHRCRSIGSLAVEDTEITWQGKSVAVWRVEPDLGKIEGVFANNARDSRIQVWYQQNEQRLPLMIVTETGGHSLVAVLQTVEQNDPLLVSQRNP